MAVSNTASNNVAIKSFHSEIFERRENSHSIIREKYMLGVVHSANLMKKIYSVLPNILMYFYTSIKYINTCSHKYLDVFSYK